MNNNTCEARRAVYTYILVFKKSEERGRRSKAAAFRDNASNFVIAFSGSVFITLFTVI